MTAAPTPGVSVIVPARDAAATLPATLRALARQEPAGEHEVIVVDNGSRDATADVADAAGVRVVRLPRGGGPAVARNAGVAAARFAALAFTDADCEPRPDWLVRGAVALARADLVQGAIHAAEPAGPFDRTLVVTRETGLHETANLFVRRDLFERVGGFAEFVGPAIGAPFGEDAVFGWRCRRAGARAVFEPAVVVRHAVFPRGPGGYISERRRLRLFPPLVRELPELREHFCFAPVLFSRRSAAFDAALAGAGAAVAMRSALPLAAAAPYAWMLLRGAARWRRRAPLVAAVDLAADAVSFAALVRGSIAARRPLV